MDARILLTARRNLINKAASFEAACGFDCGLFAAGELRKATVFSMVYGTTAK